MEGFTGAGGGGNALLYGDKDGVAGMFDKLSTAPTATNPLRYNGYFRATRVYGCYYSDSADLAEIYHVEDKAEPGDLIMVCPDGAYRKNTIEKNPRLLGVVSTDPGMVLGNGIGLPIALAGRVPVKVSGDAHAGDFLCASNEPGKAMAVTHVEETPRGSIIGMVIEPKNEKGYANAILFRI